MVSIPGSARIKVGDVIKFRVLPGHLHSAIDHPNKADRPLVGASHPMEEGLEFEAALTVRLDENHHHWPGCGEFFPFAAPSVVPHHNKRSQPMV
jgi:hypothetical protein